MAKIISTGSKFCVSGTEGTNTYKHVLETPLGKVAIREFSPGEFRVRVEPTAEGSEASAKLLTSDGDWKQPGEDGQNRFSTVCSGKRSAALRDAVVLAIRSVVQGGNAPTLVNPNGFAFAKRLVSKDGLVGLLREQGIRGANLAGTWPIETICAKIA